jgi:hypothetical protein
MRWRRPRIGFASALGYALAITVGWTGFWFVRFAFSADGPTGVAYGVIGTALFAVGLWGSRVLRRSIDRLA